jgi:hypothetical protein
MIDENMPASCRQVWDRAVEGRDVMGEPALAAHVGSCVTCFRTLAELRDVPRIAATLRAGEPAAEVDARFWDDLAERTTGAAAAALRRPVRNRAARVVGFVAIAAAAAAAVVLVAGRAPLAPSGTGARTAGARTAAGVYDEAPGDDAVDVADLDESALRRLLDRLRAGAPRNVAALAAAGDAETMDVAFEDEGQMND